MGISGNSKIYGSEKRRYGGAGRNSDEPIYATSFKFALVCLIFLRPNHL